MKGVKNPVAAALNTIHRPKKIQMKTRYNRKDKNWRKAEKSFSA
jgi:hypothetical protein